MIGKREKTDIRIFCPFQPLEAVSKYLRRRVLRDTRTARSSATRLPEPDSLRKVLEEPVSKGRDLGRFRILRPLLEAL